jgi:hypothetical protein
MIKSACGCGRSLSPTDNHGRPRIFINGHNGRKYSDKGQYKREYNHRHRKERCESKTCRGRRLKAKIIALLGGKCKYCGIEYNGKNGPIFQFHHLDPTTKLFGISQRYVVTNSWEK